MRSEPSPALRPERILRSHGEASPLICGVEACRIGRGRGLVSFRLDGVTGCGDPRPRGGR